MTSKGSTGFKEAILKAKISGKLIQTHGNISGSGDGGRDREAGVGSDKLCDCRCGAAHGAELSNAAWMGGRRAILVSACPRQEKLHWNRSPR